VVYACAASESRLRQGCLTNYNTLLGADALNSTGNSNTAIGFQTLGFNITGNHNAGYGFQALLSNTRKSFLSPPHVALM